MNICSFTTADDLEKIYEVKVDAKEENETAVISVEILALENKRSIVKSEITYDFDCEKLSVTGINFEISGYAACLVAGGLGNMVQEVLDCRKKGKRGPISLINCLRKKGHSIGSSMANIAIACCAA